MTRSWRLHLRHPVPGRVDAGGIHVGRLATMSRDELRWMPLPTTTGAVTVDDLFDVETIPCDEGPAGWVRHPRIELIGDLKRVDHIASRHDGGTLVVHGDVGDHAAAAMRGGELFIHGSAGAGLAAAPPMRRSGMSGGLIWVAGDVGDRLGYRMRRGEIVVDGNAGDEVAAMMVAGTIAIAGRVGCRTARGMRRGTLMLCHDTVSARRPGDMTGFCRGGPLSSPYLKLQANHWLRRLPAQCGCRGFLGRLQGTVDRYRGDQTVGGQGEWLVA